MSPSYGSRRPAITVPSSRHSTGASPPSRAGDTICEIEPEPGRDGERDGGSDRSVPACGPARTRLVWRYVIGSSGSSASFEYRSPTRSCRPAGRASCWRRSGRCRPRATSSPRSARASRSTPQSVLASLRPGATGSTRQRHHRRSMTISDRCTSHVRWPPGGSGNADSNSSLNGGVDRMLARSAGSRGSRRPGAQRPGPTSSAHPPRPTRRPKRRSPRSG